MIRVPILSDCRRKFEAEIDRAVKWDEDAEPTEEVAEVLPLEPYTKPELIEMDEDMGELPS